MTVITDVPQSGVYIQRGAIFKIVAQILDFSTGLPVPLQTASGMSISIMYPDGVTSQTFAAQLYTDGADGMIVYTTINNGTQVDLSQVGLYHFQASAVLGGVQLPQSYQDDFYVLDNVVSAGSPSPLFTSSAVIFFDSNNVRWAQGVSPSGLTPPVAMPSGPGSFLQFQTLVMQDSNGIYWQGTMSTAGVLNWAQVAQTAGALQSFVLNDVNGRSWIITISTAGVLTAS